MEQYKEKNVENIVIKSAVYPRFRGVIEADPSSDVYSYFNTFKGGWARCNIIENLRIELKKWCKPGSNDWLLMKKIVDYYESNADLMAVMRRLLAVIILGLHKYGLMIVEEHESSFDIISYNYLVKKVRNTDYSEWIFPTDIVYDGSQSDGLFDLCFNLDEGKVLFDNLCAYLKYATENERKKLDSLAIDTSQQRCHEAISFATNYIGDLFTESGYLTMGTDMSSIGEVLDIWDAIFGKTETGNSFGSSLFNMNGFPADGLDKFKAVLKEKLTERLKENNNRFVVRIDNALDSTLSSAVSEAKLSSYLNEIKIKTLKLSVGISEDSVTLDGEEIWTIDSVNSNRHGSK